MILTLVGVSYGTLDASARRARGIGADVFVRPPGSSVMSLSSAPMPEKIVAVLGAKPGVALATGTMVQSIGGFDTIQGVDFPAINKMAGGFKFLQGGPMQADDDIIVDEYYAKQKKLAPGDHIKLINHDWRVSGVYESGKLARILVRMDVLQRLTGNEGHISAVYLKLDDPNKADAFVKQLRQEMNPGDPDHGYMIYTVEEFTSQLSLNNVTMLKDFIYVVIGVATIVGFIVVFMAMYTAVLERTREIGILKAVGAGPGYILNILFRETPAAGHLRHRPRHYPHLRYAVADVACRARLAGAGDGVPVVANRRRHRHRRRDPGHDRSRLSRREAGCHRGAKL